MSKKKKGVDGQKLEHASDLLLFCHKIIRTPSLPPAPLFHLLLLGCTLVLSRQVCRLFSVGTAGGELPCRPAALSKMKRGTREGVAALAHWAAFLRRRWVFIRWGDSFFDALSCLALLRHEIFSSSRAAVRVAFSMPPSTEGEKRGSASS